MVAAAPAWFADNVAQIAAATLLVVTFLVIRLVQKAATRVALLALVLVVAVLVYANRAPLKACAKTCTCEIAGRTITVPTCDPDLGL